MSIFFASIPIGWAVLGNYSFNLFEAILDVFLILPHLMTFLISTRISGKLRSVWISSIPFIVLGSAIYFFFPSMFNVYAANVLPMIGLQWITNALILYSSLTVFSVLSAYLISDRILKSKGFIDQENN